MASYIGNPPVVSATRTVTEHIATAGQTVFTANGGYTVGYVDVLINGVQLQSFDFTATDGNTITLAVGCAAGDEVRIIAYGTFSLALPVVSSPTLDFTGTGQRIRGDFSNATVANRVMFQSSTTNGNSIVSALPNGTSNIAQFQLFNNSDLTNAGQFQIAAGPVEMQILSNRQGTGTFLPMTFYTGGSERMRIDTSGNVGIGTSSPAAPLDIARGSGGSAYTSYRGNGNATASELYVGQAANNYAYVYNRANAPIEFGTNNITRALIDASGNLLVNTTSSIGTGARVQVFQASGTDVVALQTNTTNTQGIIRFYNPNGAVGNINTSGSSTAYATSSDYRLKDNIQPMTGALSKVSALKPCTYTWKADGSAGEGFIAHELAEVVPQCVTGEKDAVDSEGNPVYQGIDTSFLVATLTAAIQEQQAMITSLKERIEALENK